MEQNPSFREHLKNLSGIEKRTVEKLLSETRPYRPVPSVFNQWLAWLILAGVVAAVAVSILGAQADLIHRLFQLPFGIFLALLFFGSAFAAWNGIASSMPGEEPGTPAKAFMGILLIAIFAVPFFFFTPDQLKAVLEHDQSSGWFCFRTVVILAVPYWVMLAWTASRNASYHPGWTAAWLGISAFLLGTGTVQMHCTHWECTHVLVNHLLPMILFLVFPICIGSYWLSRWKN